MPYLHNPNLNTYAPKGWNGTPTNHQGRFVNLHTPFRYSLLDVLKWQTSRNPDKEEKKKSTWRIKVNANEDFLKMDNSLTWLGHASFLLVLGGKRILIDPILYPLPLMPRYSDLPCKPESLKNIDYLLISHNHRDHADEKSIRLLANQNPDMCVLSGLKNEILLKKWLQKQTIETAGWYQQFSEQNDEIKIFYLPSRHWAVRFTWDLNQMLWGAFVIQYKNLTIYFGGDSGYDAHFKETSDLFPNINYAILGIGAFEPRWFMGQSHTAPDEAVKAFHDLRAKNLIPMHYATFDLADEPLHKPIELLKNLNERKQIQGNLLELVIGEPLLLKGISD